MEHLLDRRPSQTVGRGSAARRHRARHVRDPRCSSSTSRSRNLDAALRMDMRTEIGKLQPEPRRLDDLFTHDQVEA